MDSTYSRATEPQSITQAEADCFFANAQPYGRSISALTIESLILQLEEGKNSGGFGLEGSKYTLAVLSSPKTEHVFLKLRQISPGIRIAYIVSPDIRLAFFPFLSRPDAPALGDLNNSSNPPKVSELTKLLEKMAEFESRLKFLETRQIFLEQRIDVAASRGINRSLDEDAEPGAKKESIKPIYEIRVRRENKKRDTIRPRKFTIVNFWASYCVPCLAEMPRLVELRKFLTANCDGEVFFVNTDYRIEDGLRDAQKHIAGQPFFHQGDDSMLNKLFGHGTLPLTLWFESEKVDYSLVGKLSEADLASFREKCEQSRKPGGPR